MSSAPGPNPRLIITMEPLFLRADQAEMQMQRGFRAFDKKLENTRGLLKAVRVEMQKVVDTKRAMARADATDRAQVALSRLEPPRLKVSTSTDGGEVAPRGLVLGVVTDLFVSPPPKQNIAAKKSGYDADYLQKVGLYSWSTAEELQKKIENMESIIKGLNKKLSDARAEAIRATLSSDVSDAFKSLIEPLKGLPWDIDKFKVLPEDTKEALKKWSDKYEDAKKQLLKGESSAATFRVEVTTILEELKQLKPDNVKGGTMTDLENRVPTLARYNLSTADDRLDPLKQELAALLTILGKAPAAEKDLKEWIATLNELRAIATAGTAKEEQGQNSTAVTTAVTQFREGLKELLLSAPTNDSLEALIPFGLAEAAEAELGRTGEAYKQLAASMAESAPLLEACRAAAAPSVNLDHLGEQLDFYRELRTLMPEAGEKYEELRRHMAALQEEQYRAIGIEQQYLDTWRTWVELREATDFSSGLMVGVQDYISGLTAASVAQSSVQSGADAFRGGLFNVARGFQGAGDAAREFGSHILDLFTQMIIDMFAMKAA